MFSLFVDPLSIEFSQMVYVVTESSVMMAVQVCVVFNAIVQAPINVQVSTISGTAQGVYIQLASCGRV